jgi:hypothetical protein
MDKEPGGEQSDQETREQEKESEVAKDRDKGGSSSKDDETEEAAEDTFPASDPPAW